MWWFLPTAVGAVACFLVAVLFRVLRRRGLADWILAPWLLLPMAALVIGGPAWIVATIGAQQKGGPIVAPLHLLIGLGVVVGVGTVALMVLWLAVRSPYREDRCPSCGHQLLADQATCPECGAPRILAGLKRVSMRLARATDDFPMTMKVARVFQAGVIGASFLVLGLFVVPTPRLVTVQRAKGTSNGTVFDVKTPEGSIDRPFTLATEIHSKVLTAASFAAPVPLMDSEVGMELRIEGEFKEARDEKVVGPSRPISIARLVRSRADIEALVADLDGQTAGLSIPPVRDPLRSDYELFLSFAQGYWPAPDPTGATPPPAMPTSDRALSPGSITPAQITFGVPLAIGVLAAGIARGKGMKADERSARSR